MVGGRVSIWQENDMQLYFLTAVGWSLDANGNLQAVNTAGTIIAKFLSGGLSTTRNKVTSFTTNSPVTTTTSTSFVSTGRGFVITPQVATNLLCIASFDLSNNTAGDSMSLAMVTNAAATPVAGGTASGTSGQTINWNPPPGAGIVTTLTAANLFTGLTAGTQYAISILFRAITGGTVSIQTGNISGFAEEI